MTHASLFSGIGGFDLAARNCGIQNIFQVEINEFCQQVLEKNFPETIKFRDIKTFDGTKYYGSIDIISGGFPCQPFSVAGKRKGTEDDRFLWAEMLRVITEVGPSWVIAENVPGLLTIENGMVFEQCVLDLEAAGYEVEAFNIPAISVDAPHRRERIWIVAHSDVYGNRGRQRTDSEADGIPQFNRQTVCSGMPCRANQALNTSDSENCRCGGRISEECTALRTGNISPTECSRHVLGSEVEGRGGESTKYIADTTELRLYGRNASSETKHGQAENGSTEAFDGMLANSDIQRELQSQGLIGEEWRRTEYSNPTIEDNIAHANGTGLQSPRTEFATAGIAGNIAQSENYDPNSGIFCVEGCREQCGHKTQDGLPYRESLGWDTHWFEVATELCRVDDGLPNRVDRIKSLGNAIVPKEAEKLFQAIQYAESEIN